MDSFQDSSSMVDEDHDNAFYQELTRQILMLTDDDDDQKSVYSNGVAKLRRMPMVYGGIESRPVARNYYSWWENGMCNPVPSWMESLWANVGGGAGGGTGVFIPSGAATPRHGKKSSRRRYNNKVMKSNDKEKVYSDVGQKIHG